MPKHSEPPPMTEAGITLPPGWSLKRYLTSDATIYGAEFHEPMANRDFPGRDEGIYAKVQWHHPRGLWFGETHACTPDAQRLQSGQRLIESHDINAVIADAVAAVEQARRWIAETLIPSCVVEFEHEGHTVRGGVFLGERPEELRIGLPIDGTSRFEIVTVTRGAVRFVMPEPSPARAKPAQESAGLLTQLTFDLESAGAR